MCGLPCHAAIEDTKEGNVGKVVTGGDRLTRDKLLCEICNIPNGNFDKMSHMDCGIKAIL